MRAVLLLPLLGVGSMFLEKRVGDWLYNKFYGSSPGILSPGKKSSDNSREGILFTLWFTSILSSEQRGTAEKASPEDDLFHL